MHDAPLTRDQRLTVAMMEYRQHVDAGGDPRILRFVLTQDADLWFELIDLLHFARTVEHDIDTNEPIVLTPDEQAMADRVAARTWEKFKARFEQFAAQNNAANARDDTCAGGSA